MTDVQKKLDKLCINTIRLLAVDMVEKAKSGHPGLPLGAAPMAYVLWTRFLRHNPANPHWPNRDRFIMSAGHGSALLYAMLHLSGYDLPLTELKNFRQWGSLTPGHPEYGLTPGVEATTGPLGQGFAMGVGMALAEIFMAESFNRPKYNLVDHYIYAIVSDGDLMEGISGEAASLAGTLSLGKLIYLYDDNGVSIDGHTDLAFTEDVSRRFQAYGWQVIKVADGNDPESIAKAITNAQAEKDQPSLIQIKTHIGYGSPKQDSSAAHGEPLGPEGVRQTKENLGFSPEADFFIPEEVLTYFGQVKTRGQELEAQWQKLRSDYRQAFPDEGRRFDRQMRRQLPQDWTTDLLSFQPSGSMATRTASGKVLNALSEVLSNLVGGSADLSHSNQTFLTKFPHFGSGQPGARNIHYGVREHAMGAIINGMALHGGVIPYGGTFLVFSDYMRPAIRLAALMKIPSIFVFTHDSIGVGEDGPTHQPVEHLASLRAIPGLTVFRPAEANETAAAWRKAIEGPGPTALLLTRQKLPVLDPERYPVLTGAGRGAYILEDLGDQPELILMATGSEVSLIMAAGQVLAQEGIKVRLVSMPSWEVFQAQDQAYQDQILPPAISARLAVEAAVSMGWFRWVGPIGAVIALDRFGASAPGDELFKSFGFTVDNVVARAKEVLTASKQRT